MAKYSDSIETDKAYEAYVEAGTRCTDPVERLRLCREQLVVERERFLSNGRRFRKAEKKEVMAYCVERMEAAIAFIDGKIANIENK
jgi:hypothetical protein